MNNTRAQLESTHGSDTSSYSIPSRLKNKGQKRRLEAITDAVQELKNLNETMTNPTTAIREDDCDVMGKHIAIQLRELPPYDRVLANFDLQKVLMDYRLRNMRGASTSTSYNRPNSVASTVQSIPHTPQITTSEESTADILHAAIVNTDMDSEFYGSEVQFLNSIV